MPNYGEDLAYWYLRLNGFFPLTNFVVHRVNGIHQAGDIDILAVRPPLVYEEIGGNAEDWDTTLSGMIDLSKMVGVLCEVKTGRYESRSLFRERKMQYGLGRLGLIPPSDLEHVAKTLAVQATTEANDAVIAKILIADTVRQGPFLGISLEHARSFLDERIRKYPRDKYGARMLFQDGVFQFLAGQAERDWQSTAP